MRWLLSGNWLRSQSSAHRSRTRLMVLSTPRSGNSWLRRMLATLHGWSPDRGTELWAHDPDGFPWESLPDACAMQLHWHPTPEFRRTLQRHDLQTVMVHRHPLDVLVSILQLARHTDETGMWLLGEGGDESTIKRVAPTSEAFHRYATGPRALALLAVSEEWAEIPGTRVVGYEAMVRNPLRELTRLTRGIQPMPRSALRRAVDECTLDRLRNPDNAPHFWQGKPDLWKRLIPGDLAQSIAQAHPGVFRRFGYHCDFDPSLTQSRAEANWRELLKTSIGLRGAA